MSLNVWKALVFLMVALSLLGIVGAAFGRDSYPTSYHWDFQNYCYFGFNQAINFTNDPHQGASHDNSLVGYWNLNEGQGAVANDSSGNGNSGSIFGATWVTGKYGQALSFDGVSNYVSVPNRPSLSFPASQPFTIVAWFYYVTGSNNEGIINKGTGGGSTNYALIVYPTDHIDFVTANGNWGDLISSQTLTLGWHRVVGVWDGTTKSLYIDGSLDSSVQPTSLQSPSQNTQIVEIGRARSSNYYNGTIDEVQIYNRALSAAEVAALYIMGPQPDTVSFANYYSYTDPVTNNTLLIYVNNPNANSNNVALVTCTNFFAGNRFGFQANNSAIVNVWTNLGQPVFTTGVWNSNNYTTTLTLDASSTAELNWNTYNITTFADAYSRVSPSNVTVPYSGNQQFSMTADSGYYISHVYLDKVDQGNLTSYSFTNIQDNHTLSVTSAALAPTSTPTPVTSPSPNSTNPTASPAPSQTLQPTASPSSQATASPSSQATASPFPTETAVIAAVTIAAIIAGFAFAFKKGYITIEVVDEENPQETSDDYII